MPGELTGKLIAEKYRVDAYLGPAGLGELYRGINTLLDKPVSISILTAGSDLADRFFSEAKAAAKVDHRNVLNLVDFGTYDGTSYAVYEAANGETLAEALKREERLPADMSVEIARQIAAGLGAAHAAGIVHGNLTPANVLAFSSEPGAASVKVFGFSTANAITDDTALQDPARFAYLSPEQCSGAEVIDARTDLYSLGVILFEMLAGERPFMGETPTEVMMRHIEEPPPPLSAFRQDLPESLEPVILRALAKDPDARYHTAGEFASDLDLAMAGQPIAAAAATAGEGTNNIWKTAFVVLVGISLLTFGLIYATSVKQTDPTTVPQADANGMPVQPINPATGIEEQNLSNLPPDYSTLGNSNINPAMVDPVPGGDGYNPWANGGAPPAGAPAIPPGGQVIQVPPGQSPFMMDPNCILQPSGIYLCPVPVTPTPAPKATPTPRTPANANTNTATPPTAATPTPQTRPSPAVDRTPATRPARTPAPANNRPDPNSELP